MIPNLIAMKFALLAAIYGIEPDPPPIGPGPMLAPLAARPGDGAPPAGGPEIRPAPNSPREAGGHPTGRSSAR